MSIRSASFFASYTASIEEGPDTKSLEDGHYVIVGHSPDYTAIYSWDFSVIDDTYNTILEEIGSGTITLIQIGFKYKNNNDVIRLELFKYTGDDPKTASGTDILAGIDATALTTIEITSTNKTGVTTTVPDTENFYYDALLKVADRGVFALAFKRDSDLTSSTGSVELGGKVLAFGSSDWRDSDQNEPVDPPVLIITYEIEEEAHPTLNMKYTTSDPTSEQSTPRNSLGRYVAINDVYPSADIRESISSSQNYVPIDLSSSLPNAVGLGSVGPEIFKYTTIDSANHRLIGVTRGISPQSSFPAGFDSFKNPEKVHYLNDLNKLFDTRPSSGLVQYRCVAIINSDSNSDFNIEGATVGICQDPSSNVQIRIGVEVPRYDSRTGVAVDGNHNTSSTLLVTTIVEEDGFYDGALIKLLNPTEYVTADSYAVDSGTYGEFILSRSIAGLVATRNFVIMPAPAQSISSDAISPTTNSGRFTGFQEDAAGMDVSLLEHGSTMQENDLFYVWIRRTLQPNVDETNDTGAVIIFRYRDTT